MLEARVESRGRSRVTASATCSWWYWSGRKMATPGFTLASAATASPSLPFCFSLSFRPLSPSRPHAAMRSVPGPGVSAADYEQVRRYCSSRVHARARQHRGAGQSRRWHGSAVPEGPSRQPGRHVPREGEWSLFRDKIRQVVSWAYLNSLDLRRLLWLLTCQ